MTRSSKEQRRDDYLDIGAELVVKTALAGEADAGLALSHVKIAEVAERAGVSKGALYHLWPSQEAYWNDLLRHLLDEQGLFGSDAVSTVAEQLEPGPGPEGAIEPRSLTNALFAAARDNPGFFIRIALFSYLNDDAVRDALDKEFRAVGELLLEQVEAAIAETGRRLVEGVSSWDFIVVVGALLEGMCLQYRMDPARTPDLDLGDGRRWSLFGAATEGILLGFTEELPVADDPSPGRPVPGADPAEAT